MILIYVHIKKLYSIEGTASPEVAETFQRSLLAAQLANKNGKVAKDAPPVNIGWDSHKPVVSLICMLRRGGASNDIGGDDGRSGDILSFDTKKI